MRAERELDLELLDNVTWPDYAWEWLRYMGAHILQNPKRFVADCQLQAPVVP